MPSYRCRHCKSRNVQGTLPAWFNANTLEQVEVDAEADWDYGFCEDCDASGDFWSVCERDEL